MSAKPVIPRELANRDVEAALDHYLDQGGEAVALGFVDAETFDRVVRPEDMIGPKG